MILRSIGAVLAGFFATFILSIATDLVLHAVGVFPPWGQSMSDALFVLAMFYRTIYTIGGGYVTARLAPNKPMSHALILGVIGLLAAIAGTVATWNKGPEFGRSGIRSRLSCSRFRASGLVGSLLSARPRCARRESESRSGPR